MKDMIQLSGQLKCAAYALALLFSLAAFVLVKDGKVIFSKGYGYANLEKQTPVNPDRTVFRVASVSKVFTATAVMQLAESGKLDLNRDVNLYLSRFKVKDPYPQLV